MIGILKKTNGQILNSPITCFTLSSPLEHILQEIFIHCPKPHHPHIYSFFLPIVFEKGKVHEKRKDLSISDENFTWATKR